MGTTYTVLKTDTIEVEIDEGSNVFSLDVSQTGLMLRAGEHDTRWNGTAATSRTLTPDDLVKMGLEILKVASYWCASDEFDASVRKFRGTSNSYEASMLRSIGLVGEEI